ncbi:hypothetical protein ACGFYQ_40435 [Streptomyces sp. NPDC048258]|uniref:hypothetical protein n=1 Tax=Streptomyces sp. NPDC048258 TaxID=3365527 RepID=UPI00371D571E
MGSGQGDDENGSAGANPESTPGYNAMNDDDALALRNWFDGLSWQDPRYDSKFLLKLAALSMGSDEMRRRLLNDTDNLVSEVRSHSDRAKAVKSDPLEGVTLRFWENTPDTLHIVLPPRAGAASELPERLQNALRSRTSLPRESGHIRDDASDFGDWYNVSNRGNHGQDIIMDT